MSSTMNETSMTDGMMVFNSEAFSKLRALVVDGEPWFVAIDVCKACGISNITRALTRVDQDDFTSSKVIDSMGREQNAYIVNEAGFYSIVLSSKKPEAKAFKRWVTHEVLPSIRKHGGYIAGQEAGDPSLILANALKVADSVIKEKDERIELERERAERMRKAMQGAPVPEAMGCVLMREMAKILTQNGFPIGQNRLFDLMVEQKFLFRTYRGYEPYQDAMEKGLFLMWARKVVKPDGEVMKVNTVHVTKKGQEYFVRRWCRGLPE